jgi:hypothetical protein
VAEAVDLWRHKLNVDPASLDSQVIRPDNELMPFYGFRGLVLEPAQRHREWAPGMRTERGIDSLGELALLSRGAEFETASSGDYDGDQVPDLIEIAWSREADANRNGLPDGAEPVGAGASVRVHGFDFARPDSWNQAMSWSRQFAGLDPYRTLWSDFRSGAGAGAPVDPNVPIPGAGGGLAYRTDGVPANLAAGATQRFPLSGRTAIDRHLLVVSTDDRTTRPPDNDGDGIPEDPDDPDYIETDDPATPRPLVEREMYRYDQTATDGLERNSLLKGISNIATVRSDVFTVWVRIRTIRQDPLTGRWPGMDPEYILDDSRYMMTIDRSSVDRPGEAPRILSFVKVPN